MKMKKMFFVYCLTFTLAILLSSCVKEKTPAGPVEPLPSTSEKSELTITNLENVTAILHAGGELDGMRLLNCQEAFYVYYEQGYRYFEYDIKLSCDGRLISTHSWEHLSGGYDGMGYNDFISLRLDGGYTPVNEEWLIEMLKEYSDVTVIVDAKMETTLLDAEVIKRLNELQRIHNVDLSDRIIPEIFSIEMWDEIKEKTSFNKHLFSRYKVYYSIDTIIENFSTEKFIGIALPYDYLDGYYKRNIAYLQENGYRIFMFGINDANDVIGAMAIGADTVYVDNTNVIPSVP